MKHNYSNADIRRATVFAGLDVHAADIRLILNALPEPVTDDWQECRFENIQKGDRFKVEHADWSYEGQVKWIDAEVICYDPRIGLAITPQNIDDMRGITLYRIPATVQHPDPEVDKYILVHKADPKYNRHIFPNVGMSNGTSGYGVSKIHIPAEHILEWEELTPKVVEDDR